MSRENKNLESEVAKTFGQRMKSARELCGYSLKQASEFLGYHHQKRLLEIETGTVYSSIPTWLIPKAAQLYDVSTDFLFGLIDEPSRILPIPEQTLLDQVKKFEKDELGVISKLDEWLAKIEKSVLRGCDRAKENQAVLYRFAELNPGFVSMKLSKGILNSAEDMVIETRQIAEELTG